MLSKKYTVTVQDKNGETLQIFGNNEPPTDADIEVCLANVKGGMFAFVDTTYYLKV